MIKIKKLIALVMTVVLMCGSTFASADVDYMTGTPWLDPEILGNVTAETNAELKDHFVLAVNYDLYLNGEIPEGRSSGGTTSNAKISTDNELNGMFKTIDPSSSHNAELCVNYYNLLLDWDAGSNA